MSISGSSSEPFSFAAALGGNVSQSSPGSNTGASSADAATVMTMPSQASGESRAQPPASSSRARSGNTRVPLKRFQRSTSPVTKPTARSPKSCIEKARREEVNDPMGEIRLTEDLRSSRIAYQQLYDEYTYLQAGYIFDIM